MKVQIKTLNQKSLSVDIDAEKTVLDLKKELALYPDIGVCPEQQKLIYAGKILENSDILCNCNIDEKKFLVVMIVKGTAKPKEEEATSTDGAAAAGTTSHTSTATQSNTAEPIPATTTTTTTVSPTESQHNTSQQDEMVANIVSMGYPEAEVRQALEASFNNPERAVEYLIEGIPMSPNIGDGLGGGFIGDTESDADLPPFELLRADPVFRNLRSLIQQNPELIDEAVSRIGEANPALLTMINDHQQEFLDMLFEQSDEENDAED